MATNNRVYKTAVYELKNPQKYKGTKAPKFKSSFEERMFWWCDVNENVLEWSYEPYPIDYIFEVSPSAPLHEQQLVDNKSHKYYPDVVAKIKTNQGIVNYILEIKPYSQTVKPTEPKKKTKKAMNKYLTALQEFLKNAKKWEACRKYARKRDMKFWVLTERDLFA